MIETTDLTDEQSQRLDEAIGAYYEAIDRGVVPDRLEWQNRYPDLARELAEFFEDQSRLGRIVDTLEGSCSGGQTPRGPRRDGSA